MFDALISAGYRLSGVRDARLYRGLFWSVVEGACIAAFYPCLYVLLVHVFGGGIDVAYVLLMSAAMLLCVGARMVVSVYAMPLVFSGAFAMMGQARLRVADHLRRLPMGWFADKRSGDLSARLTTDLALIENLWSHFLGVFAASLSMPVFLLGFLLWLDWRMALIVVATLPLAGVALVLGQYLVAREVPALTGANSNMQSEVLEYVRGIAVIRSFGRLGFAWEKLKGAVDAQYAAAVVNEVKPAMSLALFGLMIEAGFVVLVLMGCYWLRAGAVSAETLVIFCVMALPIHRQVFNLGVATILLRYARRAMARIEAILAAPVLPEPANPVVPATFDIGFDRVSFEYGQGMPVLTDVTCEIPAGKLTAIVGPSGAGKSTLMHAIARLWDVKGGQIAIGGVDIRDIDSAVLYQQMAMVFQDVVLFSGSVLDNIRVGNRDASREAVVAAAKMACADTFISALPEGYDTLLDENGGSLSGGERQRISIARALLKNAPILLLDEVTASVDPSAQAQIQRGLNALVKDRTVVVIAHRLHSIRHADQILVMDGGKIVETGSHAALLAKQGLYARLWGKQEAARVWQLAPVGVAGSAIVKKER